jgi:hypothetical protein
MSVKELQEIAKKYDGRVAKLLSLGRDRLMKSNRDSYVKKFGFTKDDVPQLLALAQDMDIFKHDYRDIPEDEGIEYYGVIHAWFVLSELEVAEFKEILIQMVEDGNDNEYDEWILENFVDLIKPYRKSMYEYFAEGVVLKGNSTWTRLCYIDTIKEMLKADEVSLQEVEKLIVEVLSHGENDVVNASTMGICMDYKLTEHHELIKECYARDAIDLMYNGDLEDVEIRMGLREQRETQKEPTMLQKLFNDLDDDFYDEETDLLPFVKDEPKVGRNDSCPCGSGKKYKKCCMKK